MYKELVDIAKQIITIANIREKKHSNKFLSLADMKLSSFDDTYDKQLTEIFNQLTLDEVIALVSIMYLGRDKDYNANFTPDEIFLDYKKYIESVGLNTKEIATHQMLGKAPLGTYLTEGYRILGINL